MREKIPYAQRLTQHRNSNSRSTRLQKISGKKALESLKQAKKRNLDKGGASPKRRKSRRAEPPVNFLRGKAAADREIRQQELREKQQEQES